MGRNHLCEQAVPEDPAHLLARPCGPERPSGLSFGFPKLFPSRRQLDYVLLARPPLYSPCGFRVRLACLIHAANVRSEPGSNPSLERSVQFSCRFSRRLAPAGWLSALNSTPPTPSGKPAGAAEPNSGRLAHTLSFEATQNVKDRPAPACSAHVRGREKVASNRLGSRPAFTFLLHLPSGACEV